MAVVKVTPNMAKRALAEVDWAAQDALSDEEIEQQVAGNPEAAPLLSSSETAASIVQMVRFRLGLSQTAFAERYGIPVTTLRDWEQRRKPPGRAALSYLRVIAREPEIVARALLPA